MRKKRQHIPRFNISLSAVGGIYIHNMEDDRAMLSEIHDIHRPHRDGHYLLIMIRSGAVKAMVDFKEVFIEGSAIGLILPDQVHYVSELTEIKGYSLSFDAAILSAPLQKVLQDHSTCSSIWKDDAVLQQQVFTLAELLYQLSKSSPQKFTKQAMAATLQAVLCLLGSATGTEGVASNADNRGQQITQAFQRLVLEHFKEWRRPSVYAEALAITTSHLNDVVNAATGFSVSHHLQQAVILEARRLLSHTDKTVKEITYELGMEDHGYFSKLFKKITGQTPLQFRQQFRD